MAIQRRFFLEKAIVASSLGSVAFHIQVFDLSHILVKKKTNAIYTKFERPTYE
jgi:hypothetical protein